MSRDSYGQETVLACFADKRAYVYAYICTYIYIYDIDIDILIYMYVCVFTFMITLYTHTHHKIKKNILQVQENETDYYFMLLFSKKEWIIETTIQALFF